MGSNQYRNEVNNLNKKIAAEQKQLGKLQQREAKHRADAASAREASFAARNKATAASKEREAKRHEKTANDVGKAAAKAQNTIGDLYKKLARAQENLSKAEGREAAELERKRLRQQRQHELDLSIKHADFAHRIEQTEHKVTDVMRILRPPKPEMLRVLVMSASPEKQHVLRVDREQERIRAAVQRSNLRELLEIEFRPAVTTETLLDAMSQFQPHVVHFSGHADVDFIVIDANDDDFNSGTQVSARAFARAMTAVDKPPLLVVLNACNTAPQAERLIEHNIPMVIGMADSVDDTAAVVYAARFYASIANGQSVESAHLAACVDVEMVAGLAESELPQLIAAPDVDPKAVQLVTPSKE